MRTKAPSAAIRPDKVVAAIADLLATGRMSDADSKVIGKVLDVTLPPPDASVIEKATKTLVEAQIFPEQTLLIVGDVLSKSGLPVVAVRFSDVAYPVPKAIDVIANKGDTDEDERRQALKILCGLLSSVAPREQFSGVMFHKHIIAFRDTVVLYWDSKSSAEQENVRNDSSFEDHLLEFIQDSLEESVLSETMVGKLRHCSQLLDGELMLGGAAPRATSGKRQSKLFLEEVELSENVATGSYKSIATPSANVREICSEDGKTSLTIEPSLSATAKDVVGVSRRVRDGTARRSIRAASDMSTCSLVTFTGYLAFAHGNAEKNAYALIWLSGICGIDCERSFVSKCSQKERPKNDAVFVDVKASTIEYRVLRRKQKGERDSWESCGINVLPIPRMVCGGLEVCFDDEVRRDAINSANGLAKKFGVSFGGVTPTLRRLRASAKTHFSILGFSELQFSAVAGQISRGVRAPSHYYHESVSGTQSRFRETYESAKSTWGIELPNLPLSCARPKGRMNYLFSLPCEPVNTVGKVLGVLASEYAARVSMTESTSGRSQLEASIQAANCFSLMLYMFQELAAGLRPVGAVAQLTHARSVAGCMTADKGSRAFSERSFSPLPLFLEHLHQVGRNNHEALAHRAACFGLSLGDLERVSSLACLYEVDAANACLIRQRIKGQSYRRELTGIPNIVEVSREKNWLRRTIAQTIYQVIPQWQADEFLGHRRFGREPTGFWSTASISHMQDLRALLHERLVRLLPPSLRRPVTL